MPILPDSTKINIPMQVTGSYFGTNRVFAYRNQKDRIGHIDRPRNLFEKMTSQLYAPFGGRPYVPNVQWTELFDDPKKTRVRNYPIVLDKISDWFPKRLSGNAFPGEGYSIVLDYDWNPPANTPKTFGENQIVFSPWAGARYCLPVVAFNGIGGDFTFKLQKRNLWGSPWEDVVTQSVSSADGEQQIFRFDMIALEDETKVPFFELNLTSADSSGAASYTFIDEVSAIWDYAVLVKNEGFGEGWVENPVTPSDDSFWINNTYNGTATFVESSRNLWDSDREQDFTYRMQKATQEGNLGFITTGNRVNRAYNHGVFAFQSPREWYIFPPSEPIPFDNEDQKTNIYTGTWQNCCISGNDLMVTSTIPQKVGILDPSQDMKNGWDFQVPFRVDGNLDKIVFYHHSYGYISDLSTPFPYEQVENRPRAIKAMLGYTYVTQPTRNINNPKYPPQDDSTWTLLGEIDLPYDWIESGTARDGRRIVWDVSNMIGAGKKEQHTGYKEYWVVVKPKVDIVPEDPPVYDVEDSMFSELYIFGERSILEQYPYTVAGGYKLVAGEQVYDPNLLLKGAIKNPTVSPSTQLTALDDKGNRRVDLVGVGPHTMPVCFDDSDWYGTAMFRCKLDNTEYKFYKANRVWNNISLSENGATNYPFGNFFAKSKAVLCKPGEVLYGGYYEGSNLSPDKHEVITFQEINVNDYINSSPPIGTLTTPTSAYTSLNTYVGDEGIFGTTIVDVNISGSCLFEGLFYGWNGGNGNKVYITEDKDTYKIPINDPKAKKFVFDYADDAYGVNIGDPTKAEKLLYGAPLYWKGEYYVCNDLDTGYVKTREDVPNNCKYLPYQIRVWNEEDEEWESYIRKGVIKNGVPSIDTPHFSFTYTTNTPKTIRLMFVPTTANIGQGYTYVPNLIRLRINTQ